eukprot:g1938.t1
MASVTAPAAHLESFSQATAAMLSVVSHTLEEASMLQATPASASKSKPDPDPEAVTKAEPEPEREREREHELEAGGEPGPKPEPEREPDREREPAAEEAPAALALSRKGKWTREEEDYANKLIEHFHSGVLPIAEGTTLRCFLSNILNCEPMRISKKFAGKESIGKRVFKARHQVCGLNELGAIYQQLRCLEQKLITRLRKKRRRTGGSPALDGQRAANNVLVSVWQNPVARCDVLTESGHPLLKIARWSGSTRVDEVGDGALVATMPAPANAPIVSSPALSAAIATQLTAMPSVTGVSVGADASGA